MTAIGNSRRRSCTRSLNWDAKQSCSHIRNRYASASEIKRTLLRQLIPISAARGITVFHRDTNGRVLCFAQARLELQLVLHRDHLSFRGAGFATRNLAAPTETSRGVYPKRSRRTRNDTPPRDVLSQGDPLHLVLSPLLEVVLSHGLDAWVRASYEIIVNNRQIASACLSRAGDYVILAASLALDQDASLLAGALNTYDSNLQTHILDLLRAHRTSLKEDLGFLPRSQSWKRSYKSNYR